VNEDPSPTPAVDGEVDLPDQDAGAEQDAAPGAGVGEPASDDEDPRVAALRDDLEGVDDLPVQERVEVFERVNQGIADELARLDEV
jgi:hypothetical protein